MSGIEKLRLTIILLILVLASGTAGFMAIENMEPVEAVYMTVITISTVGFREVRELSSHGQVFTIFLIIFGILVAANAIGTITSYVIEGEFNNVLRSRKMENRAQEKKKHYIICGAGETGHYAMHEFKKRGIDFIAVDKDERKVDIVSEHGGLLIVGDATSEVVLKKAGIMEAHGLLSCLSRDSDNVFTVLTARGLNPRLHIVSRAIDENVIAKLHKAGADKTVSPNEIGGVRMASLAMRPDVVTFLDVISNTGEFMFDVEHVDIKINSGLEGKTPEEIRQQTGVTVMAVRGNDGDIKINIGYTSKLIGGETIIVLGQAEQVEKLKQLHNR